MRGSELTASEDRGSEMRRWDQVVFCDVDCTLMPNRWYHNSLDDRVRPENRAHGLDATRNANTPAHVVATLLRFVSCQPICLGPRYRMPKPSFHSSLPHHLLSPRTSLPSYPEYGIKSRDSRETQAFFVTSHKYLGSHKHARKRRCTCRSYLRVVHEQNRSTRI